MPRAGTAIVETAGNNNSCITKNRNVTRCWISELGNILLRMVMSFFYFLKQFAGKNEMVKILIIGFEDIKSRTLPFFDAVFHKDYVISYFHDGVHVVGVDYRANIIFDS